ncbi:ARM repeat-containing protein [Martensiomyces pterosporus]|nr:ARM repeat-containing protein [Martensiomyces pterosporus]
MADVSDLELLEALQLRFALASSDEQMHKLVSTLLVPLLDKLDIASAGVRTKAIGLLGQINKKLRGYPAVTLPIGPLFASTFAKESKSTAYSQGFRLMYIMTAVERAAANELVGTIPQLLHGIASRPASQTAIITTALLTAIQRCPDLTDDSLKSLDFTNAPEQAKQLLLCAADLFLFNPISASASPQAADGTASVATGLSPASQSLLTNEGKARWVSDSDVLRELKLNMLRIVGSDLAFPTQCPDAIHEMRFLALLCSSCDPYFPPVASRGEDSLKRLRPFDYESASFVSAIFDMFLGSTPETAAEKKRSPAPIAVRLKLVSYLNRSAKAAASFPQWLRVIFESLFGTGTSSKLRRHGMMFMQWVIRMAPQDQINRAAPILMQGIRKILAEGTAANSNGRLDEDIIRGSAFVAWGTLGKRAPSLVSGDLTHLRAMFDAFNTESANVRLSIQEALLAMLPAYHAEHTSSQAQADILVLLKDQLSNPVRQARYCALRYAISAFPFSRMDARWICLLGMADSEREIHALAQSGLSIPPSMLCEDRDKLPELTDAIHFLHARMQEVSNETSGLVYSASGRLNAANAQVYGGIIDFGRSLLLVNGILHQKERNPELVVDVLDLESINESKELSTELQRDSMRMGLSSLATSSSSSSSVLKEWTDVVSFSLASTHLSEATVLSKSLVCLVELMSLGPQDISLAFFDQRQVFISLVGVRNPEAQLRAVQALAIVYAIKLYSDGNSNGKLRQEFWNGEVVNLLSELLVAVKEPVHPNSLDKKQGSILALGHIVHGLRVAQLALNRTWAGLGLGPVGDMACDAQEALLEAARCASKSSTHPMVASALCTAIGEIGKAGAIVVGTGNAGNEAMAAVTDIIRHTNEAKVQDAAFRSLANVAMGDAGLAAQLVEFLQKSASGINKKQLDAHFRIGEALAMALGRFKCSLVKLGWIFPLDPSLVYGQDGLGANAGATDSLLGLVVGKMVKSTNPQERQAATVWTLSLVQFCPKLEQLNPWLSRLHTCLCSLLTDRDEFTQEVASKTLGLVYDMGDASLKEDLVYSLMSLFGGSSGSDKRQGAGNANQRGSGTPSVHQSLQQQIQSDQPLLEHAELGQTPDGHAVNSTYKSILSLASDMQNPSLVYQFMQLASHTAVWNSRRGAAYGFASVIERARESMRPYMKSIVPKLYRYTFDPSPQTRAAMTSIWRALLGSGSPAESMPTPAAGAEADADASSGSASSEAQGPTAWAKSGTSVVETFWDPIIEECLASMGQREWRVRESGCSALAGTIPGASPELVVPYLERIWQMAFRALDDIKGSVRESGLKACQALATATVAWCTPRAPRERERDKRAQSVLSIVVPFLVDKGVVSDAEDVRGFSLGLLLKLCKASGSYLTAFAPSIAERLLESLSNMEPQAANYLTFHADAHNISQEQLESARLSAVKASPIMQGIELALEQLSTESMNELVPRLQNLIRRGVGLPTRAGCARIVVTLCVKNPEMIRPHASALVKAISGVLTENSALQRQAWAAAIGYMAPMLTPNMFRNLLKHLEKVYFDKYETDLRSVAGLVLEQLAQRCPERLRENVSGPGTISFVIFGSWDAQESVRESFRNAWQEYALGSGGRLVEAHLADLLERPVKSIADDRWHCRVQGANAIADVAGMLERAVRGGNRGGQALAGTHDPAVAAIRQLVGLTLQPLTAAFQGRVWPGREHVLGCLVKVCTVGSTLFAGHTDSPLDTASQDDEFGHIPHTVFAILVKEMTRGELAYRRSAVTHYCSFIEAVPLDVYGEVSGTLLDIIQSSMVVDKSAGARNENGMDVDEEEPMQRPQRLMLIAAATKALSLSLPETRPLESDEAMRSASPLREIAETGVWNTRVASLEGLSALIGHCKKTLRETSATMYSPARAQGVLQAVDLVLVLKAVRICAAEGKYVAVRTAAFDALEAVFGAIHFVPPGERSAMLRECDEEARRILDLLLLDPVPSISDRAKDVKPVWSKTG